MASNSPLEALIFDCDGTLINSMEYFYIGWDKLVRKYNYSFPKEQFYSLAGLPVPEIVKIVMEQSGAGRGKLEGSEDESEEEYDGRIKQFLKEKHEIVKGMRENGLNPNDVTTVTNIARKNKALSTKVGQSNRIPMAVASSGDRDHVIHDLKQNGLFDELFTVEENLINGYDSISQEERKMMEKNGHDLSTYLIVTRECVEKGKPAPDLFLEACRRLGANPANCKGFEDADLGIESLRNAGFKEENIVDVRKLEGYPK